MLRSLCINLLPAALAALLGAAPATADPADDILLRFVRAEQGVNLVGKLSALKLTPSGPRNSVRQVVRSVGGTSIVTYLEPASERGMVVWEDRHWARKYLPGSHELLVRRSYHAGERPADAERMVRLIRRNYRVEVRPPDICASRKCDKVRMVPVYEPGRTVELWIDRTTGAALCRQESDSAGNTLALSIYTSVQFPPSLSKDQLSPHLGRISKRVNADLSPVYRRISAFRKAVSPGARVPLTMRGGYAFQTATLVSMSDRKTVSLRYTDGLAEASIFWSAATTPRPRGMVAAHIRPIPMGERELVYVTADSNILIVGALADDDLYAVAQSMSLGNEEAWINKLAREFSVPVATVAQMRDSGLATDAVAAILEIAARARRGWEPMAALVASGYSWRDVARRYRVPPQQVEARFRKLGAG